MAVIVAISNTSLATVGGFKRSLASNIAMFSATELALSSSRTIAVTPAAAENCNGIIIALTANGTLSLTKGVIVTLEENVATVWTARATQTFTAAQIASSPSSNDSSAGVWFVHFGGGTFPYAVTAAAATWRFTIVSTGAGSQDFSIRTSDATNPFFVMVGDTAVSYADNADVVVAGDCTVELDQNFTLKGALGTGDAVRSVCAIACTRIATVPYPDRVPNFIWDMASTVTGNIDGLLVLGANSGFSIGRPIMFTAALAAGAVSGTLNTAWGEATGTYRCYFWPNGYRNDAGANTVEFRDVTLTNASTTCTWTGGLTYSKAKHAGIGQLVANPAVLNVINATSGTAANTGFSSAFHSVTTTRASKMSIFMFGTAPDVRNATIGTTAVVGAGSIVTTDVTGWVNGDEIFIGGQNLKGIGVNTVHTVSSSVGTTVNFAPNIGTNNRLADGHIIKLNGYSVTFQGVTSGTGTASQQIGGPSNLGFCGLRERYINFALLTNGGAPGASTEYSADWLWGNLSFEGLTNMVAATLMGFVSLHDAGKTVRFDHVDCAKSIPWSALFASTAGSLYLTNSLTLSTHPVTGGALGFLSTMMPVVTDNFFENGNASFLNALQGVFAYIARNRFFGNSGGNGAVRANTLIDAVWEDNIYINNTLGRQWATQIVNDYSENDIFSGNTTDINLLTSAYVDSEMFNPSGALIVSPTTFLSTNLFDTSILKISNYNLTANDDRQYHVYTEIQRTGFNLTDTNVFTSGLTFGAAGSGQFALRMKPLSSIRTSQWPLRVRDRAIPTGNILGQVMAVTCKVKINNAAFYAGTHQKPRLNVKFDNSTTVYSEAIGSTSGQLLSVSFTPTTSNGQIEVWLSGFTDATGTNAYFYIDDLQILYPAGVNLNLSSLDNWAHASPVWPPIATVYPTGSEWDRQTSAHTSAGSFGEQATRTEIKVDDNTALILTK